jgi:hypothetical protein
MNRVLHYFFAAFALSCFGIVPALKLFAQTVQKSETPLIGSTEIRPDSLDLKRFPAPKEVVTFGVGVWGAFQGTINTYFTTEFPSSLPTFNISNRSATLDVRPTLNYGLTLYAPSLFGEKLGINLDLGLSSYNYGTLYNTNFIFSDQAADSLRGSIRRQFGNNVDTVSKYLQPKFFTSLQYLTVSPMLNLGGFLVGANIGVPIGDATVETPSNAALNMQQSTLTIPQRLLNLLIEPRLGIQVPIIPTRFGTLFLNANISFAAFGSPLSDSATLVTDNFMRRTLDSFALPRTFRRYRFDETTAMTGRNYVIDSLRVRPISANIGLSFLISVGNNNDQVDEILREERRADSLRIVNADVSKNLDAMRQRSIGLADKAITTIIQSSKISDRIAALEKEQLEKQKTALKTELVDTKKKVFQALFTTITGLNDDGTETPENPTVRIEQFQATTTKSLLPKVFFDQGSAVLSTRYKRITAAERESYKIPSEPFAPAYALYPNVLNIIGKRLATSSAKLTLTGFQTGDESDAKLAEKRAEALATYFQDVWKIPAARITRTVSKGTGTSAAERRVEISSESPDITAPLSIDYTARLATPPIVAIGMDINAGVGLKQWELEIQQIINNQGVVLKDTNGGANYPSRFLWRLNDEPATMPQSNDPVSMRIGAFDVNNAAAPDAPLKTLKVEQISLEQKRAKNMPDKTVQQFEVIFANNLSDLDASSRRAFDAAKAVITPQSKVLITVYGGNASVSARSVAQALSLDAKSAILRDAGTVLNASQLPEAAAYNHLVRIRVETPNQK